MRNGTVLTESCHQNPAATVLPGKCRRFLIIGALLLLCCNLRAQTPVAWVVNGLGETLARINLSDGQVDTNAVLLGTYPNDIVIQQDRAYVVNSGSNNLQIIDLNAQLTLGTIEILLGLSPYYVELNGNDEAFVSNSMTGNVSVLDLQTRQETDTLTTGVSPEGLCVTAERLFVTDTNLQWPNYGTGHLFSFSLPDLNFIGMIDVGTNPQIVRVGPDSKLHVVCTGNFNDIPGKVKIVDPQTLQIEDSIAIGGTPGSLAFNSVGIGYLGSAGLSGTGHVLTYNGYTHQIIHDNQNPIQVPSAAMDVAITQSDYALVCCFNTDEVVELDAEGNFVRSFIVGYGPLSIALQEPPSAIEPKNVNKPTYQLVHTFPEPFNSATNIVFDLQNAAPTLLQVFDPNGRLVDHQDLGVLMSGRNQARYRAATGSPSGVYYYRILAGEEELRGSMLYLK